MTIKAFPKILPVGHSSIPDLLNDEVEITEKIDGSQFSFGKINGEFKCRSKGVVIDSEPMENDMFKKAWDFVHSIKGMIYNNTVYYCEYLQKPKHNTLSYERAPNNNLILFGMAGIDDHGNYMFNSNRRALEHEARMFDIEVVPLLYQGKVPDAEFLFELIDRVSVLGNEHIEGIVLKNYNKDLLLGGQYMPITAAKYVSEKFKEKHQKSWSKEHTVGGKFGVLKSNYRTEARWDKAIQHLRDEGKLVNEPKDIGLLIKAIKDDIVEEEKEDIKEALWKIYGSDVLRNATAGFPEYYKQKLLEGAFEE